ncbi:MAG TPA: hypothetical protein VFZ09_01675 [Archangium sp.]|uniref:hypothetical protein n=1 Tax=Archangium sp. TaxID=1872627 RepID=UPI002E30AF35|nr:hypothetical protein [Archangium sp.]HEX5744919.1 hypothetical protein [Archangium sp.]
MRLVVPILILLHITACVKRNVRVDISNTIPVQARVIIVVKDQQDRETEHQEMYVQALKGGNASTQRWGPIAVPIGHQVNVTWSAVGSSAVHSEQPLLINDGGKLDLSKHVQIANVTLTSPEESKTALEQLASRLEIHGKEVSRLVDVVPNLGALIIARVDGAGNVTNIVDRIPVTQPTLSVGGAAVYEDTAITTREIFSQLAVNVPLYADIQSSMSVEGTYSMKWSLRQYPWDTRESFINAVATLNQRQKSAFAALLEMQPTDTRVFYISKMQVLEKAVFSVAKGQKDVVKSSGGAATIFTGEAEYYFDHRTTKIIDVSGYVYDIVYNQWGTRDAVLAYLRGTEARPPEARPAAVDPNIMLAP